MPHVDPAIRDTRIDVIRALALLSIFIIHIPGNPFEPLTHKNFGFSDATEAFVLISGIAAAMAYGGKFVPGRRVLTTLTVWRRCMSLYMAQLFTTMATLGIFAWVSIHFGAPHILARINIAPVMNDTAAALLGIVTLGHQLGYNNILSMYAGIMLLVPLFLLIGTVSLGWMVVASGLLWLVAGLFPIAPAHYPNAGYWFLNPFSWQFLFVIGMAAMLHVRRGGSIPVKPWLAAAAAFYLVLSLLWVKVPLWGIDISMGMPRLITGFNKTFLSLPRLLHILSIGYLLAVIPALSAWARLGANNPLAVLGRHGLAVFVAGTVLSMAAQAWRGVFPPTILSDVSMVVGGVAAQFALAYYLDWHRKLVRATGRSHSTAAVLKPAVGREG